ncbi:MAG: YerC/YecD family TrpR-related protein [bacterium]|nr:YerC/YecD family TrpR-related protein [bacterium]
MDLRSDANDRLFEAVLNLESIEDCYSFFEDLCTIKELRDLSQRFQIATLLDEGHNYQSIMRKVDASTTTISRVNQCLNYGAGGYRAALNKMKTIGEAQQACP